MLQNLDRALRPLWRTPDERYQALFSLQELTRVAVALHLYAKALEQSTPIDRNDEADHHLALKFSHDLADLILAKILSIVNEHDRFETTVSPPSALWEHIVAFLYHSPQLDLYFYLYGLLDCATKLSSILRHDNLPQDFKSRMLQTICDSKDNSYRWKAVSSLLLFEVPTLRFSLNLRLLQFTRSNSSYQTPIPGYHYPDLSPEMFSKLARDSLRKPCHGLN